LTISQQNGISIDAMPFAVRTESEVPLDKDGMPIPGFEDMFSAAGCARVQAGLYLESTGDMEISADNKGSGRALIRAQQARHSVPHAAVGLESDQGLHVHRPCTR
jgi:hypothetical protein